jgi:hypothetical protein
MLRKSLVLSVFVLAFATPVWAAPAEASRLRILLVIDTLGDNHAQRFGAVEDGNNMIRTLTAALKSQKLEGRYTLTVLKGKQATPANVLAYYRHLKTGPNESLLFYYTGHGCLDRSRGQIMTLNSGNLYRGDLRKAMEAHHPRLAVILTDCCSGYANSHPQPGRRTATLSELSGPDVAMGYRAKAVVSGAVLHDLFFRHQGLVMISAAKAGQLSYGNPSRGGSYFTVAFCKFLQQPAGQFDRNRNGLVEWREFYPFVREETDRLSRLGGHAQSPQALKLGQPN